MDLMCNENEMLKDHHFDNPYQNAHNPHHNQMQMNVEPQVNTASADKTFLSDRCLQNLLKSEETHPTVNFYNNSNYTITPKIRRILAEWMMEVSLLIYFTKYLFFFFK